MIEPHVEVLLVAEVGKPAVTVQLVGGEAQVHEPNVELGSEARLPPKGSVLVDSGDGCKVYILKCQALLLKELVVLEGAVFEQFSVQVEA